MSIRNALARVVEEVKEACEVQEKASGLNEAERVTFAGRTNTRLRVPARLKSASPNLKLFRITQN